MNSELELITGIKNWNTSLLSTDFACCQLILNQEMKMTSKKMLLVLMEDVRCSETPQNQKYIFECKQKAFSFNFYKPANFIIDRKVVYPLQPS